MLKTGVRLFLTGSVLYPALEMVWRGHTHSSMALAGGICLWAIHGVCNVRMTKCPLFLKCLAGAGIITGVELATGLVVNRWLHLGVWDYSRLPLNILGQVCLPFSILWAGLTVPAMAIGTLYAGVKKK